MKNKKIKLLLLIVLILMCMIVGIIGVSLKGNTKNQGDLISDSAEQESDFYFNDEDIFNPELPWEKEGAKKPEEYTKEEYEDLTLGQKEEFKTSFDSNDKFQQWQENNNMVIEKFPWEIGGKQPVEYSLGEYELLTVSQKVGFQKSFGSKKRFDEWYLQAKFDAETYPWEQGGKPPVEYTLKEYNSLNEIQKIKFQSTFENQYVYEQWYLNAEKNEFLADNPWYADGKKPEDYSFDEFNMLSESQKESFRNSFGSEENFNLWLEMVKNETVGYPWESGGKQPVEYTLKEFNELTATQQIAFQKSFENEDAFNDWLSQVQKGEYVEILPWENGGKHPGEYTFEEFNDLTGSQQIAFQKTFESNRAFNEWLSRVQEEKHVAIMPWEIDNKTPNEYTLDEFNALTGSQQIAFQNWFKDPNGFDEWLANEENNNLAIEPNPWEIGGKLPNEYSLDEFNSLTGAQQIAFQKWFNNSSDFDAWLSNAQKNEIENADLPWENGGKHPQEYTWTEFEALTGPQQIAFQQAFASYDDFETWMYAALGE